MRNLCLVFVSINILCVALSFCNYYKFVCGITCNTLRPGKKKKMFICPFPTDPKYLKIKVGFFFSFLFFFFLILNFVFSNKNVFNMSEFIATVPKMYFNHNIMEYKTFQHQSQTNSACPKMHTHEWYYISSVPRVFFFFFFKQDRPTNPPNF